MGDLRGHLAGDGIGRFCRIGVGRTRFVEGGWVFWWEPVINFLRSPGDDQVLRVLAGLYGGAAKFDGEAVSEITGDGHAVFGGAAFGLIE